MNKSVLQSGTEVYHWEDGKGVIESVEEGGVLVLEK